MNLKLVKKMCCSDILVTVCLLLTCAVAITAQSTPPPPRRCFQFTWLGPNFNNTSVFENATCQDATRLANGIPCQLPLVVSYDGTWPDVEYIWRNYPEASCVLPNNGVCAQFSYYFDGHVENSTYKCTRAVDTHGTAINSGCYEQRNGSFVTRVCFCRSEPGGTPCNDAVLSSVVSTSAIILTIVLITNRNFVNMWLNILN